MVAGSVFWFIPRALIKADVLRYFAARLCILHRAMMLVLITGRNLLLFLCLLHSGGHPVIFEDVEWNSSEFCRAFRLRDGCSIHLTWNEAAWYQNNCMTEGPRGLWFSTSTPNTTWWNPCLMVKTVVRLCRYKTQSHVFKTVLNFPVSLSSWTMTTGERDCYWSWK